MTNEAASPATQRCSAAGVWLGASVPAPAGGSARLLALLHDEQQLLRCGVPQRKHAAHACLHVLHVLHVCWNGLFLGAGRPLLAAAQRVAGANVFLAHPIGMEEPTGDYMVVHVVERDGVENPQHVRLLD